MMSKVALILVAAAIAALGGGELARAQAGGVFGTGKFEIKRSDDRFTAGGLTTVNGWNNRVSSKSGGGGRHFDGRGMYLNPSVTKNARGEVEVLSLVLLHRTFYDTAYGGGNLLGALKEVAFAIQGQEPIVVSLKASDSDWSDSSYNTVSQSASADVLESGVAQLTPSSSERLQTRPPSR